MLPRPSRLLDRRLPLCRGQSLYPDSTSHRRGLLDEASTRIHAIHPSGLPLARGRPDGTGRRFGFPPSFEPADQEPTTHVEVGTGHRARTWNYSLNITSVDPPIGSSLTTCDLASHDESEQRPTRDARRSAAAALNSGVSTGPELTPDPEELRSSNAAGSRFAQATREPAPSREGRPVFVQSERVRRRRVCARASRNQHLHRRVCAFDPCPKG